MSGDDAILERVKAVIAEVIERPADSVTLDTRFEEDLEIASYDQLLLILALEDELGVEIDDDEAIELKTVGHAVDMVRRLQSE